ncbi:penicillin-binding protein 1C [Humitalea sp. 24SJ18S-53]|uniref:penicillin-binding protein 1C n=1 Tax=Humitalea sp. 24SJ18S-53 TaxID=3422307 RepID=UPI003D67B0D4
MRRGLLFLAALIALALVLDRVFPPDLTRLQITAREVTDRAGRTLSWLPAPGGVWRMPTAEADVSPHLVALLIAAEDRRFYWHPGVDPMALARAAGQWVRAGRVVSGGSTISMQAARLLEPRPRTLRSKAIEVFRALQLEARFGKSGVLGIWLTLAPQGGNLEGIRAGSLAWFGRDAGALDAPEAALLVALARRPEALRPDRHPDAARAARDAVLGPRGATAVGLTEADRAQAGAIPTARKPIPRLAPHLSRDLARRDPAQRIPTTLDAPLQRAAETVAAEALRGLPDRAAVALVIGETAPRAFRAVVGGSWMEESRGGALDLTRAIRSPGSALKPALYALAFEMGAAEPGRVLEDLPRLFGTYAPENFDGGFAGRVTAAEALRRSLNLPAVALLDRVGALRFAGLLRESGAPARLPLGAAPALPLALGGAGLSLRELTNLYAMLAGGGMAAPFSAQPGMATPRRVLSPRAAGQVAAVLVQPFPGGGPAGIAWKTGTSWGGRDAWAIGFDGRHVAGVWIGRPDGTPLPGATGRDLALPVLARIFGLLPAAPRERITTRAITAAGDPAADRLRLVFPPPGAVLHTDGDVTLRAQGGQRPLAFLVDGAPLRGEPARRDVAWAPPGPGFYRITVLDASGAAARTEVRVVAE